MNTTGITMWGDPDPERQMLCDLSHGFEFRVLHLNLNAYRATTRPQMAYSVTLVLAEPMDTVK